METSEIQKNVDTVLDHVMDAVVGDREFFRNIFIGLLSGGHVLIEDVPGTGKTLTSRSFANSVDLEFTRIQFTPDLLPKDVVGNYIYNESEREFEFNEGPIFGNVVLADEINRAPPKTQAALLESMEEGQVTVDGNSHELPKPFYVIATQNPVEQTGTFPLPEAQKDRFWLKTEIGYPSSEEDLELLERRLGRTESTPNVSSVLSLDDVVDMKNSVERVEVDTVVLEYIRDLARTTRRQNVVELGVSPRGMQRLLEVSRARALTEGREFVIPEDVKKLVHPVLEHRLILTPDARVKNLTKQRVISQVVNTVATPTV
ncbi:MAG: AAA family ATPase [Halobacteria archaeon]